MNGKINDQIMVAFFQVTLAIIKVYGCLLYEHTICLPFPYQFTHQFISTFSQLICLQLPCIHQKRITDGHINYLICLYLANVWTIIVMLDILKICYLFLLILLIYLLVFLFHTLMVNLINTIQTITKLFMYAQYAQKETKKVRLIY